MSRIALFGWIFCVLTTIGTIVRVTSQREAAKPPSSSLATSTPSPAAAKASPRGALVRPDATGHEGQVYVHGYTTKAGRHVEGYWRNKPGYAGRGSAMPFETAAATKPSEATGEKPYLGIPGAVPLDQTPSSSTSDVVDIDGQKFKLAPR